MEREPGVTTLPKNLQFRVGLLLGLTLMVAIGFVVYVLYARGVFEARQRLTLVAENAEGVSIGMDLTFSGFPIGRVNRMALDEDGRARIDIDVPRKDARWLRTSSVFTIERGVVGSARIRAYTGNLQDPPLADGAVRPVLRGDASEEIPRMVATLRTMLENVEQMTAAGGSLQASLANLQAVTERLAGRQGALAAVLGGDEQAKKVTTAIDRANALLASLSAVSQRFDGVLGKTDQRVFGEGGVMDSAQRALAQANGILGDLRETLKKADQVLADAQQVGAHAKAATTDLATLRTASREFDDCPAFEALRSEARSEETAYAEYLSGRAQRAASDDALSRLVGLGVQFKAGRISPAGIAQAVEIASAQGWRRPLLAWLGVQAKRAEDAGDSETAARIRRRIELISG